MKPHDRDLAYIWDMCEAARLIIEFTSGFSYAQFAQDKKTQSAVERQLEILGEAARRVSEAFRQNHPEVPWRAMIGLRNILAHEYGEIRVDRIWLIATTGIPEMLAALSPLLPPVEEV